MNYKILHIGNTDKGYGNEGIVLGDVFSVEKTEDNTFIIREECDGWYTQTMSKEELLTMLEELKNWIDEQ